MGRPTPVRVTEAARTTGDQIVAWRKLQGLTAAQVADRVGVSRALAV